MNKNLFICFAGIDGSGKTSISKEILKEFHDSGIPLTYRWGKYESNLLKFAIFLKNKLVVKEDDWKINYEESLKLKKGLFDNKIVRTIYEYFYIFSCATQSLKVVFPLIIGKNVLCDRYVIYDALLDLACDLNYDTKSINKCTKRIQSIFPKPDILFFLDIPVEVAFGRKKDIPSINFLIKRKKVYLDIFKILRDEGVNLVILDANKPLNDLKDEIKNLLLSRFEA